MDSDGFSILKFVPKQQKDLMAEQLKLLAEHQLPEIVKKAIWDKLKICRSYLILRNKPQNERHSIKKSIFKTIKSGNIPFKNP